MRRTERRLKAQAQRRKEELQDLKDELAGTRTEVVLLHERMGDLKDTLNETRATLDQARKHVDQFRGWWINEYHFVKVLLRMLPPSQRKGVDNIAVSSHARYQSFFGSP